MVGQKTMFFLRIKRRLVKKSENLNECSTFFIIFLLPVMLKFTVQFTSVHLFIPGRVAQSVTCLATDACLTADPVVASSIPARFHTLVEIDHEITSTVILLPSADSFKKGCCQLQAKVCAQITG